MSMVYFNLSGGDFFQDWSNTGLLTTSGATLASWDSVPSIVGFRGDGLTANTSTDPQSTTGTSDVVNLVANQTNPNTSTSGGVAEFEIANPTVALQGSGTADSPYLAIYLDASGRQNVTLSFNARDIDGAADNAIQKIAVQYRIGDTGEWINLPAGAIADASTGPSLATLVTPITVTLPATVNGQSQVQVRIITNDAVGSDEWIGIDDIGVTSVALDVVPVLPGSFSINDVAAAEGDSGTTAFTFTVTRSGGSDGAVSVNYSLQNGTTNAADFVSTAGGMVNFADGETSKTITIDVAGDLVVEPSETFTVVLDTPTGGATITDGSGLGTITSDDLPPIANVWINEFHYDPSSSPETGEFIEVAGLAGVDLTGWTVVLYNGSNNQTYGSPIALSGTLANSADGFGFATLPTPGLQNGSPDGFALVDNFGRVVQFLSYEGTITAVGGPAAGLTSSDVGRFEEQATPGTSLQLTGTGSSYADFTWTQGNANTSGATNVGQSFLSGADQGQIRLDNAMVTEGNVGEAMLTFVVHRAGGFDTAATVDYSVAFGTADSADLGIAAALTGSVTFAAGQFTQTISIPIAGDISPEFNETLFVTLGDVTGNAIVVDAIGVGTILNDDIIALSIMQIQGEAHFSPFNGQPVTTSGIVTAADSRGFYLQDPSGDANVNTSDAIYVFTSTAPTVAVGDAVSVAGRVSEFGSDLPLTEIDVTGTGFGVTIQSTGNALPAAVLVGTGGRLPPTQSIDSDGFTIFNPAIDGADFWESLEGMRVQIDQPLVVANSDTTFGETYVVASLGLGATGVNANGGITVSTGDYNPEMIQLDDFLISGSGFVSDYSVGDQPGTVIGVINYSFSHYELLLTEVPTGTVDVTLTPEVADFAGDANYMTIATLNVENLDPSDGKYDDLAEDIVVNLRLPDVIAIQEMQDDNGALAGGTLSAAANAQGLIDAIFAASGVTYVYVEIAPTTANSTGGEPNGNIRNGYLYREDRVDLVAGSLEVINDPSYANSRLPLVATWSFQGTEITTINVHLTARSGSDPLWGATQPPEIAGEDRREDQLDAIGQWIETELATDPALNIAVLGDFNSFYFEAAQTDLTDSGLLTNLQVALLDPAERYSYVFEGNSQLLDNILVTGGLLNGAGVDGVRINAYFGDLANSDHDPQVARFLLVPLQDVRDDFDGDGRSDILWRNVDGQLSNWLGQTNGGFVANDTNAASIVPVAWQVAGTGDFNGDGRDDILWRNVDGQLSNWLGTANGGFTPNDANAAVVVSNDWQVAGTGDFDGDGRDDILWRNTDGTVSNWLGTAAGGFTPNDANAARFVPTDWNVVGTGDFNGDGRDDILWRNTNGQVSDWLGQADGGFVLNDAVALTMVSTDWNVVGTGDFNGDGRDDILWRNIDGQLSNWLGQANGGFVANDINAAVLVPTDWTVVATGDYNGDGRDDVLWRNTDGTLSDWLGTASGGFTPNDANAATAVPTSWLVQPEDPFI